MMGCAAASRGWRGQILDTGRLRLRPLRPEDAPRLTALLADGTVAATTSDIPHPYPLSAAEGFIAEVAIEQEAGRAVVLAMERLTDKAVIGCVGLIIDGKSAELGYWVGQSCWGQNYATEAARRILRLAFRNLELDRVWASVLAENTRSARVLEKLGLRFESEELADLPARNRSAMMRKLSLSRQDWLAAQGAKPHVLVAACALVDAEGRVLLAQRPPGKSLAGLWEFPGGKIDPGETPEEALVRELREELGIDTSESCLAPLAFASHDYDTFHLLMPLYVCRIWKGEAAAREGQTLRWVRPNQMAALPMPPADIPLVAILRDWL